MKKYLTGFVAVLLAISFSAFSSYKTNEANTEVLSSYYWFNGTAYTGFKTKPAEITASGCNDIVLPLCRVGYNNDDLVDPSHPELGVKSGAIPDSEIKRTN